MAVNYEKILTSIGALYRNTDRLNKQERLRLLSTVALNAPNETLKRFFQRKSKKGDLVSVNEAEIVQAREYAKQFGPGTHVMPVGQGKYWLCPFCPPCSEHKPIPCTTGLLLQEVKLYGGDKYL